MSVGYSVLTLLIIIYLFSVALPNGGTSEDGYLTSERRGGKRARRQRGSAKVSEKHQSLPPAKEAVDAGNSVLEGGSKEGKLYCKSHSDNRMVVYGL